MCKKTEVIHVHAIPRARVPEVIERMPGHYTVKVTASPDKGKANKAVCRLLARHFAVPGSAVRIIRGQTSRRKIVEIIR